MADIAQIDRILSEVNRLKEEEKIIFFHRIDEIFENYDDQQDVDICVESVFGLWKNRNITKEVLRKKAWMRN